MNGKQAKLLRKMNRADKPSKRLFQAMDHTTKGKLRISVNDFISYGKAADAAVRDATSVEEVKDNE